VIDPLTKKTKAGRLYYRDAGITAAIQQSYALSETELTNRAEIQDNTDQNYIASEVLVHRLRQANKNGNRAFVNQLSTPFLIRCQKLLRAKIPWLTQAAFEDLASEAMQVLFAKLFRNGNAGDFFEVRFNKAFERVCIDAQRAILRHNRGSIGKKDVGDEDGEDSAADSDSSENDNANVKFEHFNEETIASETLRPDEELEEKEERDVLKRRYSNLRNRIRMELTPAEQSVVILRYQFDMKIGSENPEEFTIEKFLGKDRRTVRTYLKRAVAKLRAKEK
jgi:DNA-directed RNA polymerase specialized sigma24 family protein